MEHRGLYNNAQTFCRLIEIGSFSGVANKFGISQSTVSRRITQLEEDLATTLLKRNTRSFEITEAGQKFYDTFVQQENTLDNMVKQFRTHNVEQKTIIRLSLPMGIINNILSPRITEYLQTHPNITLLAFYQNREVDLVKESFDLAIIRHLPKHLTLKMRKLYQCQFSLYCTPDYIKRYGEPKTLDELSNHLLVAAVHENNMVFTAANVTLPNGESTVWKHGSRFMLNNNDPALRIGKYSHAIIGGLDFIYQEELDSGTLVKIMPGYRFASFEFFLVRLDADLSPQLEEFIKFIESCFKAIPEYNV